MHFAILIAIAEYYLVVLIQLFHCLCIRIVPAFTMCHRYLQHLLAYILPIRFLFVLTFNETFLHTNFW